MDQIVAVTVTAPDAEWLAGFVRGLVEDRLVAGGNVVPGVRSVFRWQGAIEDRSEAVVILHTRPRLVSAVIERTRAEHPYEVPQVVAVPVTDADPDYARWVIEATRQPSPSE